MDEMLDRKRGVVQMLQDALKQSRMDEIKSMLTSKGPTEDSMSSPAVGMSEGGEPSYPREAMGKPGTKITPPSPNDPGYNKGGMVKPDMNTNESAQGAPDNTGMTVPDEQKAPELNQEGNPSIDDEIEHGMGESEDEENEPAIAMLRKKAARK